MDSITSVIISVGIFFALIGIYAFFDVIRNMERKTSKALDINAEALYDIISEQKQIIKTQEYLISKLTTNNVYNRNESKKQERVTE